MHTVLDNREWGNDFFRSLESSWNRPVLSHDSLRHNRFRVSAYKLVAASAKEAGGGARRRKRDAVRLTAMIPVEANYVRGVRKDAGQFRREPS